MAAAAEWPIDPAGRMAVAAHANDQDDLHFGTVTHPGAVVWSVIAACAYTKDITVGDAISAAAFGYELIVRLAEGAGAEHRQLWHATTTSGTAGAAGVAARLFGCDIDRIADAVAHAVSVAGGSAHALKERTSTRFFHRAHATMTGLACARVARSGKPASRHVLESGSGAFSLTASHRLTAERDKTGIEETGFRLYPTTGFSHSAIDAARAIGETIGVVGARVSVSPTAAAIASNPTPRGADEEWWSIQHAVATAVGCDIDRVMVDADETEWAATVTVMLRDGSTRTARASEPRGHPDRPAARDDLLEKWMRLTGSDGETTFDRIQAAEDTAPFADALRGAIPDLA